MRVKRIEKLLETVDGIRNAYRSIQPRLRTEFVGILERMARVDLIRIDEQVSADLVPVYIQMLKQNPAQPLDVPALVTLPEPSEGPHRGYAVQWFLFSAVVAVGYPILLTRTAASSPELPSKPSSET